MRNCRCFVALVALAVIALLGGCGGREDSSAPKEQTPTSVQTATTVRPIIRSLSFPVAYLVERLGGEQIGHECVLPPGLDPSTWAPSGELVAGLATADLIVAHGAGYEAWMESAALPQSRVLLSTAGIDLLTVPRTEHQHGAGGAHVHAGTNPHTWLDPDRYATEARAVAGALIALLPQDAPEIEERLGLLTAELTALAAGWDELLGLLKEHQLAGNDQAWAYLLARAGLPFTLLPIDGVEPPDAASLQAFDAFVSANPTPLMLWKRSPGPPVLAALKGARHVVLSPLEQPEGTRYDYVGQARAAQANLRAVFAGG